MKFAYLIMAHDNQKQLLLLLKLLDQPENDIYLHIDKKSKEIDCDILNKSVNKGRLHIYSKYCVYWGDFSQTQCQVFLLSEAVKEYHDYYHLISGHDLPIKNPEEIQEFFESNKGKEFVHFESDNYCDKETCIYFYFFWPLFQRTTIGACRRLFSCLDNISVKIQKKLNVRRTYYCGANWYSITHNLATDFCKHKNEILRMVRWTKNSDEYILQSFIRMVSAKEYSFYQHTESACDYRGTARLIDWHRGQPYVWRKEDYNEIIASDRMYARKFDEKNDYEIIDMIYRKAKQVN